MGKVNLLPWKPDEIADMESIFVELELVKQETFKSPEQLQKIESNEDLVTLKSNQGQRVNRVLVMGDAGSGKSTMAANIAYKWAKQDPQSPLSKFSLVFMISMHEVEDDNASLVDLIFQQILPEDSRVSKESLKLYITNHAKEILLLIDGMDEDSFDLLQNQSSTVTKVLHNSLLRPCCLILSTRPHKVNVLGEHLKSYTQVKLKGFSEENIDLYIQRFFREDKDKIDQLVGKLNSEPHIKSMASIPVLLVMICLLFEDQCTLPHTKTKLYQATINHLWKRYKSKKGQTLTDDQSDDAFEDELSVLINTLGEAILNDIEQHDGKVLFNEQELGAEAFSLGCSIGIISRERLRSKLKSKTLVTFLHSSFQDFCAGVYLAKLDPNNPKLQSMLRKLYHPSQGSFTQDRFICSPILDFCCGAKPNISRVDSLFLHILNIQYETDKNVPDVTFHLRHIYESQLSYEEYLELDPLYSSANNVQMTVSHQLVPHMLYLLKLSETSTSNQGGLFSSLNSLTIETDSVIPQLPSLLQHTANLDIFYIDTNDSNIKTTHLTEMYKAIATLPKLTKLWFADRSQSLDATDLLHMLTRHKPNKLVQFLLLSYHVDVTATAEFLVHSKKSLSLLGLAGTLDAQGQPTVAIDEVIKVLPDLKKLVVLYLVHYNVSDAVEYLRPIVPQLIQLFLENCALEEKHLLQLFSFLHTAQKLTYLRLSHNAFSVSSITSLVGCLNAMPHLVKLALRGTDLNDESACILSQCLKDNPTLSKLDLRFNPGIRSRGWDALRDLPCTIVK